MSWRAALSRNLRDLRVTLCPDSEASKGIRDFMYNNYVDLKKLNPNFPILVRDGPGAEARLIARYDFGKEVQVSVGGLNEQDILLKLRDLVKDGESLPRSGEGASVEDDIIG
mmetsp:Transcript_5880/g.9557  ORF Transcript_5880/g.9557 Transcript_5880/m.9557 type:complete len:112 (+) Transcript_5880:29-364(+)